MLFLQIFCCFDVLDNSFIFNVLFDHPHHMDDKDRADQKDKDSDDDTENMERFFG